MVAQLCQSQFRLYLVGMYCNLNVCRIISAILLLIIFHFDLFASTRKDVLLKRREQINKEITTTENLLKKIDLSRGELINSVSLINRRIALRRELIENLNDEVSLLQLHIDSLTVRLKQTQQLVDKTKQEYAMIAYRTYFYFKPQTLLTLLFSASDLGEMYRRYVYLRQYHAHRRAVLDRLRTQIADLYDNSQKLARSRAEKLQLLAERERELTTLNNDLAQAKESLKSLQKRAKELQAYLENLKNSARKVEEAIRSLVESEVQKAKSAVQSTYSRQVALVSAQFEQNKGRLPFPVARGVIISEFGEQSHPLYKGIKIVNNGIDVSCDCDIPVYAVFGGVVSKVFFIKGSNYAVIVRHGNFYTVYQNLANVVVSNGQEIKVNTVLGNSSCMPGENVARLHFEIWRDLQKLNPAEWLAR